VRDAFQRPLWVQDAGRWKPAPQSYAYALAECGVTAEEVILVAVHPWDVDGAARAGLRTAWVDRGGHGGYPPYIREPRSSSTPTPAARTPASWVR
jgi:2-haloacid dehalogenase